MLLIFAVVGGTGHAGNDRPDAVAVPESTRVTLLDGPRLLASFGESRGAYTLAPLPPVDSEIGRARIDFEVRMLTELGMYERADSLLALTVPLAADDQILRYAIRRGTLNLMAGRYQRVLDCLAITDSISNPTFTAYLQYLRLKANVGLERTPEAIAAGERLLKIGTPASLTPESELVLVDAYSMADRPQDALELVDELSRRLKRSRDKTTLHRLRYELLWQTGNQNQARSTAVRLARSYRHSRTAQAVSLDVIGNVDRAQLKPDELLAHTAVFIEHGNFKTANRLLRTLDQRKLNGDQREERLITKARYHYRSGNYRMAAALAKPRFSTPAYRRESILILARSYRRMGKRQEAADLYRYFSKLYPNDGKAAEALHVAVGLYESTGQKARARETLDRLRKSYPSSYYGRMATYKSAWRFNEAGQYNRGVTELKRAVSRSRRTDDAALFYLADTYRRMGSDSNYQLLSNELQILNPYSFYVAPRIEPSFRRPLTTSTGKVALDGEYGLLVFLTTVTERKEAARITVSEAVAEVNGDIAMDDAVKECLQRGEWFLEVGFRDWGERELDAARRHCLDSPVALLDLGSIYDRYGMPWQSIRLYQRVKDSIHWKKRQQYASELRYLMYPVPYPVQVLENAARSDLPPHLIYAMIREESRFDRRAVSRVGALGLMQLMPDTARRVARELEMPEWTEESLMDPEVNLAFGVWYAASLAEALGGDYLKMLAGYNAGPANAKRWFNGSGKRSTIEIVDGIDYKETRLYVQRIVESANVYHSLYFDADQSEFGSGH